MSYFEGLWPSTSSTQTFSKPTIMSLQCIVQGESSSFEAKVTNSDTVNTLKYIIKRSIENSYPNTDAKDLVLWKAELPTNRKEDIKADSSLEEFLKEFKGSKLDEGTESIEDSFFDIDFSKKRTIHVIVKRPPDSQDIQMTNALNYTPRRGGLGGTTRMSTEGNRTNCFEGIDLNSPDVCLRQQTVEKLVDKVAKAGVLFVRSPPMSGKTSLAQLLEQHLLKDSTIRVIRISLLWMQTPDGNWNFADRFEFLMNVTWNKFVDECNRIKTIFIVDEIQMLYAPKGGGIDSTHHGGAAFWKVFKDCQQASNLYIVAFAAYGYRGAWDGTAVSGTMDVSPFMISPDNTWNFENVCFTEDEYEEYFSSFYENHLKGMKKEDVSSFKEYLHNMTNCHPGLVAFFMNHIEAHFFGQLKLPRDGKTLTFEKIFKYLKTYDFYAASMTSIRAYKQLIYFTDLEKDFCDNVFRYETRISELNTYKVEEERMIKTNMLVERNQYLEFSSPYLCSLYMQERWGFTKRPSTSSKDFKTFLFDTFSVMNSETLKNTFGTGKDKRLLERSWQMEFYRAATQVLPNSVYISPDVGAKSESNGFVDFYVDDGYNWAIELLQDGDKAQNHEDHFKLKGTYSKILEKATEWVIIDIRNPDLLDKPPVMRGGNWMNVFCQKGWKSVIIEYKGERKKITFIKDANVMEDVRKKRKVSEDETE